VGNFNDTFLIGRFEYVKKLVHVICNYMYTGMASSIVVTCVQSISTVNFFMIFK